MQKSFDDWNHLKKDIHNRENHRFFKQGEIWWINLGVNIGYEADGKGDCYERPVLILKKYNQFSFLAVPLTTANKENPYKLSIGKIEDKDSFINTSQLRYVDSKRLTNKVTTLDKDLFLVIKQKTSQINFG